MSLPTTACVDLVTALKGVVQDYITANPSLLRAVYTSRPGAVGEVPFAFIGGRDETQTHTDGVRNRTFVPTVVVVDTYADNEQTQGRLDVLQDGLTDAFTAAPHALGYGVMEVTSVKDVDIEFQGNERVTWYRSRIFVFETFVAEGRN